MDGCGGCSCCVSGWWSPAAAAAAGMAAVMGRRVRGACNGKEKGDE